MRQVPVAAVAFAVALTVVLVAASPGAAWAGWAEWAGASGVGDLGDGAGDAADGAVDVTVRVEGPDATVWTGTVTLEGTYDLTADTSGETYTLEARTPLGALHAAAGAGGFDLYVNDDFASTDFTVEAVEDVWRSGVWWWDYRVNWVATYYGNQRGWLAHGPGLEEGDRILWYLETTGSRPLRLTVDAAQGVPVQGGPGPGPDGAAAVRIEWPLVDPFHRPGKPWPTQVWLPAHGAEVRTDGGSPVPAPAGAAVVPLDAGEHALRATVDPALYPVETVRSNPATVVVDA